mgnify:CR=1 FL=1
MHIEVVRKGIDFHFNNTTLPVILITNKNWQQVDKYLHYNTEHFIQRAFVVLFSMIGKLDIHEGHSCAFY